MTHINPMPENAGDFTPGCNEKHTCLKCKKKEVVCQKWESSDGAYEDYKYNCTACGHTWWVDGIDS
jgi:DNA-directed RNA polymerase subunit M/transcription elongation factor TFIIS